MVHPFLRGKITHQPGHVVVGLPKRLRPRETRPQPAVQQAQVRHRLLTLYRGSRSRLTILFDFDQRARHAPPGPGGVGACSVQPVVSFLTGATGVRRVLGATHACCVSRMHRLPGLFFVPESKEF
jgi:hypothetical protein